MLLEILQTAERDKVAVGHFNISDLAALKAIVECARELNKPVLIGLSEGERTFIGIREAVAFLRLTRDQYGQNVFLNADHTHSLAKAEAAAKAGCDLILFDGSSLSFEANVLQTKKAVETIKSINPGILVEGEIGYIGDSSKIHDRMPSGLSRHTTPEEACEFVESTHVDLLAPAVGNMHGVLKSMVYGTEEKRLNIDAIAPSRKPRASFSLSTADPAPMKMI